MSFQRKPTVPTVYFHKDVAAYGSKGWVTIGGGDANHDGHSEHHHGGTPVEIDESTGKIDKGPSEMVGKTPEQLASNNSGGGSSPETSTKKRPPEKSVRDRHDEYKKKRERENIEEAEHFFEFWGNGNPGNKKHPPDEVLNITPAEINTAADTLLKSPNKKFDVVSASGGPLIPITGGSIILNQDRHTGDTDILVATGPEGYPRHLYESYQIAPKSIRALAQGKTDEPLVLFNRNNVESRLYSEARLLHKHGKYPLQKKAPAAGGSRDRSTAALRQKYRKQT